MTKRILTALAAAAVATVATVAIAPQAAADEVPDIQWPPAGIVDPHHSVAELQAFADTMTDRLEQLYPQVVPQAQDLVLTGWGGEAAGSISEGQDYLSNFALYTDARGSTGQALQVNAPGLFTAAPREVCQGTVSCTADVLPDDSLVLHTLTVVGDPAAPRKLRSATHFRPDGGVVTATAYNYDPANGGALLRPDTALDGAQLAVLATDPQLHL